MEPKHYDNTILKIILDLFNDYSIADDELPKENVFRLMFENKLIDVCDYNIFYVNHYLNQLNPENDYLTYEEFLVLLFFIYGQQLKMLKCQKQGQETFIEAMENNSHTNNVEHNAVNTHNNVEQHNELNHDFPNDINQMTFDSYKNVIDKEQFSFPNNTIIRVLKSILNDNESYIDNVMPDYSEYEKLFKVILDNESISYSKLYSDPLYHIFCSNSSFLANKNIQLMNITDLIRIIWEKNIYNNLECDRIGNIIAAFLFPIKINLAKKDLAERFFNLFDDPRLKSNTELVVESFKNINIDATKLNFTFSAFVMIMTAFALNIPESQGKSVIKALEHFYLKIIEIEPNDLFNRMEEINVKASDLDEENIWPESKTLAEAKQKQVNQDKNDLDFLLDSLRLLDKELPEINSLIKSTQNSISSHANDLFINKYKPEKFKFPLQTLKIELDENLKRRQEDSEKAKVEKLKGVKKNNSREPPPKPVWFEELPDKDFEELKYFGEKTIETLKHRFMKNSYKDILMNSNVYPCLIKEVMMIPKKLHYEVFLYKYLINLIFFLSLIFLIHLKHLFSIYSITIGLLIAILCYFYLFIYLLIYSVNIKIYILFYK